MERKRYQSIWSKKRLNKSTAKWRWRRFLCFRPRLGGGVLGCGAGTGDQSHWSWGTKDDLLPKARWSHLPDFTWLRLCGYLWSPRREEVGKQPLLREQEDPDRALSVRKWKSLRFMLSSSLLWHLLTGPAFLSTLFFSHHYLVLNCTSKQCYRRKW